MIVYKTVQNITKKKHKFKAFWRSRMAYFVIEALTNFSHSGTFYHCFDSFREYYQVIYINLKKI